MMSFGLGRSYSPGPDRRAGVANGYSCFASKHPDKRAGKLRLYQLTSQEPCAMFNEIHAASRGLLRPILRLVLAKRLAPRSAMMPSQPALQTLVFPNRFRGLRRIKAGAWAVP